MLRKIAAILIIIVGIAGLVLPFIPGALLIATGFLLFYKDGKTKDKNNQI